MTEITISPATPDDIPAMSRLLAEMDQFYGSPATDPEQAREQQIRQALFSQTPAGHALLARCSQQLAGLAAYSFLWPAYRADPVAVPQRALHHRRLPAARHRQAAHRCPLRGCGRAPLQPDRVDC